MKTRCSFVDPSGVQCPAFTEQPEKDKWSYLLAWGPGVPDGHYCPKHAKAIEEAESELDFDP
jgi:hypothetical protein